MQMRRPKAGDVYRHFKNNLYEVIATAIHSETEEEMVVYKQKYGEEKIYVRPLDMFLSEVDHEKYPDINQKYRFELVEKQESENGTFEENNQEENVKAEDKNDFLMRFLDAKDYREKLLVLEDVPEDLDDHLITNMALSVDLVIEDGTVDARLDELIECLKTKAKFECLRLR